MRIEKRESKLVITLSPECTIGETEAHLKLLQEAMKGPVWAVELRTADVTVMDTAYLQLILSLKQSAAQQKIGFGAPDLSAEILRVCELYGIPPFSASEKDA